MENLGTAAWMPGYLAVGMMASAAHSRAWRAEHAAADHQQAAEIYAAASRGHARACNELRMRALCAESDRDIAREALAAAHAENARLRDKLAIALDGAGLLLADIEALKSRRG